MDREKIIETLALFAYSLVDGYSDAKVETVADEIISACNQWISVEELTQKSKYYRTRVLVHMRSGDLAFGYLGVFGWRVEGYLEKSVAPTHWQPLPGAPEDN